MIEAVIFDCDGVLIDSEAIINGIVSEILTDLGYQISKADAIRRFIGRPECDIVAEIQREWGQILPAHYHEQFKIRVIEAYSNELKAIPGIAEALQDIRVPICVASSSGPDKLRLGLEKTGLYQRFAPNIISATQVARGKPAPDIFLFAAGWLRISPLNCLVIEDSEAGTRAALQAGIRVVGFTGGSHCGPDHGQRLLNAGASAVFDDMRHLSRYVEA